MNVILGSSSPRRKEFLARFFSSFEIVNPDVHEDFQKAADPLQFCVDVTKEKFAAVKNAVADKTNTLIITADTIVVYNNKVYGKPKDKEESLKTLMTLSGKTHSVITSLAVGYLDDAGELTFSTKYCETFVTFKQFSEADAKSYIEKTDCSDKAGSYAVQENAEIIIDKVDGSQSNVIGFPVTTFLTILSDLNILHKVSF